LHPPYTPLSSLGGARSGTAHAEHPRVHVVLHVGRGGG
jgi:hypothetical protein